MAEAAAKALQASLKRAALLKRMSKSHVTGGFWLGGFGEWRHELPDHSCDLALEYRGEHWPVRWLCDNPGLSGGWRTFAIAQKLLEGDFVLFEKKDDAIMKTYIFRAADYAAGAKPAEDAFFEDAAHTDFKGRKVASSIGAKRSVKREVKVEPGEGEGGAPPSKKPRVKAESKAGGAAKGKAAAAAAAKQAAEAEAQAGAAGAAERGAEEGAAGEAEEVAGAGLSGRRNPSRVGRPEPGALKDVVPAAAAQQGAVQPAATAKGRKGRQAKDPNAPPEAKKPRAPRKPRDPNAPPPKPRAPRKPRDPNAPPPKPRAPRKPVDIGAQLRKTYMPGSRLRSKSRTSVWDHTFPEGKLAEMAAILKARHALICKDGVRIDKKSETILDPWRPLMRVHGFKLNAWVYKNHRYRPIHSLFQDYTHFERLIND